MTMVVLTSAAGSPGVTTSALGLALAWPRPVLLVEADPTGGSALLAGYFRGTSTHMGGLIDLAWAHRAGSLAAALPSLMMQVPNSKVQLLPGVRAHGQARSLTGVWDVLAVTLQGLAEHGQDVIVDAGRLGLDGSPDPLMAAADLTLLTVRSHLVALSAARSWAETLRTRFDSDGGCSRLGVLLVGEGQPYRAGEVTKVLNVPVVGSLAWDPGSAAVFTHGAKPSRRFQSSSLVGSLRSLGSAVEATVTANHANLEAAHTSGGPR